MERQPIDYAKTAIETMMRKYQASELPPKGHFHYHQGVFLSGVYQTYQLYAEERYFQYIQDWVNSCIDEDGNILDYNKGQLDDIQPGILLFPILERTGDERYKKILDRLITHIREFPRNPEGGYFHKEWYPQQMWLDGLYMAGPLTAQYADTFHQEELFDVVAEQILLMREKTIDEKTGLWYHAYDYSRTADWADPVTGRSPEFWGRSIGWVPVAVLDDLDFIPGDDIHRSELEKLTSDLLKAVCTFQAENGFWYQIVDKVEMEGNWPEISCTCLFVAALCKAVRKGILDARYLEQAKKGYDAVISSLSYEGENLLVGGVCIGTAVGDYAHYIARPVSVNDLHGVGAFLIMCTQAQQVF